MIDSSMKAFNGDSDGIDSNISYSQTDPQTARFAESFKVKIFEYKEKKNKRKSFN
jgi:Zn-finger nucleic acid-binding protein